LCLMEQFVLLYHITFQLHTCVSCRIGLSVVVLYNYVFLRLYVQESFSFVLYNVCYFQYSSCVMIPLRKLHNVKRGMATFGCCFNGFITGYVFILLGVRSLLHQLGRRIPVQLASTSSVSKASSDCCDMNYFEEDFENYSFP